MNRTIKDATVKRYFYETRALELLGVGVALTDARVGLAQDDAVLFGEPRQKLTPDA